MVANIKVYTLLPCNAFLTAMWITLIQGIGVLPYLAMKMLVPARIKPFL
jgi:hypothetical protein